MAQNNDKEVAPQGDEDPREWRRHLTPTRKRQFAVTGRYLVEQQVFGMRYKDHRKRRAAMYWLHRRRFWDGVHQLLVPAAAALAGAGLTWFAMWSVQDLAAGKARASIVLALQSEILALAAVEAQRRSELDVELKRLVTVGMPRSKGDTRTPSRWLYPRVSMAFPVFDRSAGQIGLLPEKAARSVAAFYLRTAELRSHVNHVMSVPILFAGPEKAKAVSAYKKAHESFQATAQRALADLRAVR